MATDSTFMSVVSSRDFASDMRIALIWSVDVMPVMALSLRFMWERVMHISDAMKS